ncbi:hypothetical protein [Natronocella acetinitrilica]|uniref:hypothetical protein n=1 Tax=Natronocella acetinitrilica TaxID=414046 RepID=UPI00209CF798|nr:hypothetical protein [Natronocella acetinitrilica]
MSTPAAGRRMAITRQFSWHFGGQRITTPFDERGARLGTAVFVTGGSPAQHHVLVPAHRHPGPP